MWQWSGNDLAIDLGSAYSRVAVREGGVIVDEPSVVAVRRFASGAANVIAIGREAQEMEGREPADIEIVRPVHGGAVADFDLASELIRNLIERAETSRWRRPRVAMAASAALNPVQARALRESAIFAGAREVILVPRAIAAALGAGLPIAGPGGHLLLDIGAGTTEVTVLTLGGIAVQHTIPVGGDAFNQAIIDHVRLHYNVLVGEQSAEQIKRDIGSAQPQTEQQIRELKGRDLALGVPAAIGIKSEEIRDAMSEPLDRIVAALRTVLEQTPPELSADIVDRGMILVGGGAELAALDLHLRERSDLSVVLDERASHAVALGIARCLADRGLLQRVALGA